MEQVFDHSADGNSARYFGQLVVNRFVPVEISDELLVRQDLRLDEPKENSRSMLSEQFVSLQNSDKRNWILDADCREVDPELFFTVGNSDNKPAKIICGNCTSKEDCLQFALSIDEKFGIWGGMTRTERIEYKNKQKF